LQGGDGNDWLDGGDGVDILDGGTGIDTFVVDNPLDRIVEPSNEARTVINSSASEFTYQTEARFTGVTLNGADSIDINIFFEALGGPAPGSIDILGDLLGGSSGGTGGGSAVNLKLDPIVDITGNDGDNIITTFSTLSGSTIGDSADVLRGRGGDDELYAGALNDLLEGGAGADILDGGDGFDIADYTSSPAAVTIDLALGTGSGGDAEGDTLISIEGILGSAFDDDLTGNAADNLLGGAAGADALDGAGGNDLADYSLSPSAVTIDLAAGTASGGHAAGDTFTSIESIRGSAFDDVLRGDASANEFDGGAGSDTLVGGGGIDTVDYRRSDAGVTVSLSTGTGSDGDAEGDSLATIENLRGSGHDDNLTGDGNANVFQAGDGDDILAGLAGADTLAGGEGIDTADYRGSNAAVQVNLAVPSSSGGHAAGDILSSIENLIGSSAADTLTGDDADNTIVGLAGADTLDGGDGFDTVDYSESGSAVTVNLANGAGSGGHATGDSLSNFERVVGSNAADRLTGDGNDNVFIGGASGDIIDGGGGVDTVDYTASPGAVTIDLASGHGSGGHAAGDVLSGIENVIGSAGNDDLRGDAGSNTLQAGAGDDTLTFHSKDTLDGGAGFDTLRVGGAGSTVDLRANAAIRGIEAVDLTGAGDNLLLIDRDAVTDVVGGGPTGSTLRVEGNHGDAVDADGVWQLSAYFEETGNRYARYVQNDATLEIDTRVDRNGIDFVVNTARLGNGVGFRLHGGAAADDAGFNVALAGDVNNDGLSDIVVTAPGADPRGDASGSAYVAFGKVSAFQPSIALDALAGSTGFRLAGNAADAELAHAAVAAGDFDGDGIEDFLLGRPASNEGGADSGAAYVLLGDGSLVAPERSIAEVDPAAIRTIAGSSDAGRVGFSVGSGDFNGDGKADIVLGAPDATAGGSGAGAAYVIFGDATTPATIDLLDGSNGFRIHGPHCSEHFGNLTQSAASDVQSMRLTPAAHPPDKNVPHSAVR
jgi:Ca2+-binding RTX toxin-like protein